MTCSTCWFRCT